MPAKRPINGGTKKPLRGVAAVYGSLVGIDGVNEKCPQSDRLSSSRRCPCGEA